MAGKISDFFRIFNSKNKGSQKAVQKEEISATSVPVDQVKKIYRGDSPPLRQIYLWGWDQQNNPSFVVLYGEQKFKRDSDHELEDDVTYTEYAIFSGSEGHFPSFEAVKIANVYDYQSRKAIRHMYYKKDLRTNGYWTPMSKQAAVENYHLFKKKVTFSYDQKLTQKDYVDYLNKEQIKFDYFKFADSPQLVFALSSEITHFAAMLIPLYSNPNLYQRKKYLSELLDSHPSEELLDYLMKTGSNELISGLLLELAIRNDDQLKTVAQQLINTEISWVSGSYLQGLKRCANLYLTSLDQVDRQNSIRQIREHLPSLDLKLCYLNDQEIAVNKILTGTDYRKLAAQGKLSEYTGEYSYEQKKYIRFRRTKIYQQGYYSDGVTLDVNKVKDTVQRADIFGLADVIGKIAYYFDAPRLVYYFRANSNSKKLNYFRRYLRRVMDSYAKVDEHKYIEAMKSLFISYHNDDYLSKYEGNFQENYFIKHYLYHDFQDKKPSGWREGFEWVKNDQLLNLNGRYEMMKDIWNRHLDDVVDILSNAQIEVVLKAFYYILIDPANKERIMTVLSYDQFVKLSESAYPALAELANKWLLERLADEQEFDMEIMLSLMSCSNSDIHRIAIEYFKRTKGKFSPSSLVQLLYQGHAEEWVDLLAHNLNSLETTEYVEFLSQLTNHTQQFVDNQIELSEALQDILEHSLEQVNDLTADQKRDVFRSLLSVAVTMVEGSGFIVKFIEKALFSCSFEETNELLQSVDIPDPKCAVVSRMRMNLSFLNKMKANQLPADISIIEILELGSARMVKMLVALVENNKMKIVNSYSIILILLESQVSSLNDIAKQAIDELSIEEQKQVNSIILDSPDQKTYKYGLNKLYELYELPGQTIPGDLIIQLLEHSSTEVKSYIADKLLTIIKNIGHGNKELFLYYVKTLLLLPNKHALSKNHIYQVLPTFIRQYPDQQKAVEALLLEIGGSTIIIDSERALVALAQIRKGAI